MMRLHALVLLCSCSFLWGGVDAQIPQLEDFSLPPVPQLTLPPVPELTAPPIVATITPPPVVQDLEICPPRDLTTLQDFDFASLTFAPYFGLKTSVSFIPLPGTEPFCLRRVYQFARIQTPPPIPLLLFFPFLFVDFFPGQQFFDVTTSSNSGSPTGSLEEFKLKAITTDRFGDAAELTEGASFLPLSELYDDSFIVAAGTIADLEDPSKSLAELVVPTSAEIEWFILTPGLPNRFNGEGCVPLQGEGYTLFSIDPFTTDAATDRLVEVADFLGFDTSVLIDVEQFGCTYPPIPVRDFTVAPRPEPTPAPTRAPREPREPRFP